MAGSRSQTARTCANTSVTGALAAAKAYHKAPIQIAQAVAEQLHHEDFESVATAMPGFINLRVSGSFLQAYLSCHAA